MRKFFLLLIIAIFTATFSAGAMPAAPSYCEHMGYNYTMQKVENASYSRGICRFSNNSSCPAEAFLNGSCGQKFVESISCREKGEAVFPEFESCCGKLKPDLAPGMMGQPTCQSEKSLIQNLSGLLNLFIKSAAEIILL